MSHGEPDTSGRGFCGGKGEGRVMSDLISVKSAVEALAELVPYAIDDDVTKAYMDALTDACDLICQLPSVQPEHAICYLDSPCEYQNKNIALPPAHPEGIRCKDCKHYKTEFCAIDIWTDEVKIYKARPDDFCSRAERRQDDGKKDNISGRCNKRS